MPSYGQVVLHCMTMPHFVYLLLVDRHRIVYTSWLFQIMCLWTFMCRFSCGRVFSFHLGMYLGVELLGHTVTWTRSWVGEWAIRGKSRNVTKGGCLGCLDFFHCDFSEACTVLYVSSSCRKKDGWKTMMFSNIIKAMARKKVRQFPSFLINSRSRKSDLSL